MSDCYCMCLCCVHAQSLWNLWSTTFIMQNTALCNNYTRTKHHDNLLALISHQHTLFMYLNLFTSYKHLWVHTYLREWVFVFSPSPQNVYEGQIARETAQLWNEMALTIKLSCTSPLFATSNSRYHVHKQNHTVFSPRVVMGKGLRVQRRSGERECCSITSWKIRIFL